MTLPGIVSADAFVPHSFAHIEQARVYPKGAVPEAAYDKLLSEYAAIDDVRVSRITYISDGLKVTGLMAVAENYEHDKHPILIYSRGGNREYGKLTVLNAVTWLAPMARKGYLVFASNYRGNDGGEGADEFGGSDVGDIFSLLAIAKHHPGYDGKNSYMMGHSRGGMMTYIAIRNRSDFNAAVALAGLSDIRAGGRERPEMEKNVFARLVPQSDREGEYDKRSALAWANEIDTPLLLLHGDADEAVDVSHSINLDAELTRLGKPHALHVYPGGNHALRRVRDDAIARSVEWLERYRK